jgi:hypothetical protein
MQNAPNPELREDEHSAYADSVQLCSIGKNHLYSKFKVNAANHLWADYPAEDNKVIAQPLSPFLILKSFIQPRNDFFPAFNGNFGMGRVFHYE